MKLSGAFTFDKAGQGLFYHGTIRGDCQNFSLVYDCGTLKNIKSASRNLDETVEQYKANRVNDRLGLLAISHFDSDHISHIPQLLERTNVDVVMIPHIAPELRAVFLARHLSIQLSDMDIYNRDEQAERMIWFYQDPVSYFLEHGARRVIEIASSDDDEEDYDPDRPDNRKELDRSDREPRLEHIGGGRILREDMHRSLMTGSPLFRVTVDQMSWLFRPLNIQDTLPDAFYDEVKMLLGAHGLGFRKILDDRACMASLIELYDKYIGKGKRNSHSLLLRHEPVQACHTSARELFCRHFICDMCCCENNASATVLLGDLAIDQNAKIKLSRYSFLSAHDRIVLIPHHGAISDDARWLDKMMDGCHRMPSLAVSYGTRNRYYGRKGIPHPRFVHDGTLEQLHNKVAFVNEHRAYQYIIECRK